jgi:hypothetical protein
MYSINLKAGTDKMGDLEADFKGLVCGDLSDSSGLG